jgi:xanthine/uracil/vitamin C permease (AzgA family)
MSSNKEKVLSAVLAIAIGVVVAFSFSVLYGIASCFMVYAVVMLDNILDRLDNLNGKDK